MSNKNVYFNCGDKLNDIAYQLYLDDMWEKSKEDGNSDYWSLQQNFIDWVDNEQYYKEAKIILRKMKIDRINEKN